MDNCESNFPQKSSKRDGWSDDEKNFFVERYRLYSDDVGKNKRFATKKKMFSCIAEEMTSIGSTKTGDQLSSHFYSLTRTPNPKKSKQLSIIDISDAKIIPTNEASFINIDEVKSIDEPFIIEINADGVTDGGGTIVTTNEKSSVNQETFTAPSLILEDVTNTNVYSADVNIEMPEEASVVYSPSTLQMNESMTYTSKSIPLVSTDTSSNLITVQSVTKEKTSTELSSTHRENLESFSGFGVPSRTQKTANIGIATIYNTVATNGLSSNNINGASTANSVASSNRNRPVMRIAGAINSLFASTFSTADSLSRATTTQQSCSSSSLGTSNVTLRLPVLSRASTSLSLRNSTIDNWTDDETRWLLDQYGYYMDDVGPMKLFRNKNALWEQLAKVITEVFGKERTGEDLSKRVKAIIDQKKSAVERNAKSGSTRVNVAYEEEISRISAKDDSIEPEVLRDVNSVYYKQKSKNCGETKKKKLKEPEKKKPRWDKSDKPNKKVICDNITNIMLSMQQRRAESEKAKGEREKAKDERRKEMQDALIEMLRSQRGPENQ